MIETLSVQPIDFFVSNRSGHAKVTVMQTALQMGEEQARAAPDRRSSETKPRHVVYQAEMWPQSEAASDSVVGPCRTSPPGVKREPCSGQSQVFSASFQLRIPRK